MVADLNSDLSTDSQPRPATWPSTRAAPAAPEPPIWTLWPVRASPTWSSSPWPATREPCASWASVGRCV